MASPEAVASGLRAAVDTLRGRETLTRILVVVERQVKIETPVKSGNLRRSITHSVDSDTQGRVGTDVPYAILVHDGTKAHIIQPTSARALFWKGAAHPVRSVNHPGNRPNPFMERGLNRSRGDIEHELSRAGDDALGKVG